MQGNLENVVLVWAAMWAVIFQIKSGRTYFHDKEEETEDCNSLQQPQLLYAIPEIFRMLWGETDVTAFIFCLIYSDMLALE